jgi:hypothetical protein
MCYYILDDFNEVLRYFDTYSAALTYCHDSTRIHMVDLYTILGDCLL